MKREELKAMGLTDEQVESVMAKNGAEVAALNTQITTLQSEKSQLENDKKVITKEMAKEILYEIMPEFNRDEFEKCHDTDFCYDLTGFGRFRANIFKDMKGIGGVFRLIPEKIITVEDLNLPQSISEMCMLTKGLVVVTGPTGSGKSTTLAAIVDYINRTRSEHIITIEDPIEFVHKNKSCLINQREIKSHN